MHLPKRIPLLPGMQQHDPYVAISCLYFISHQKLDHYRTQQFHVIQHHMQGFLINLPFHKIIRKNQLYRRTKEQPTAEFLKKSTPIVHAIWRLKARRKRVYPKNPAQMVKIRQISPVVYWFLQGVGGGKSNRELEAKEGRDLFLFK